MEIKKKYILAFILVIVSLMLGFYYKSKESKIDFFEVSEEAEQSEQTEEGAELSPPAEVLNSAEGEEDSSVSVDEKISAAEIKIHITGEVKNPGVFTFTEGARVEDAVRAAGGFSDEAMEGGVNLAAYLRDAEQIVVPAIGDEIEIVLDKENNLVQNTIININTDSKELLKTLPGIGDVLADRIIKYRQEQGLFQKIEDIQEVSGIGSGIFENIRDLIAV